MKLVIVQQPNNDKQLGDVVTPVYIQARSVAPEGARLSSS
jgi:hypothetical protein